MREVLELRRLFGMSCLGNFAYSYAPSCTSVSMDGSREALRLEIGGVGHGHRVAESCETPRLSRATHGFSRAWDDGRAHTKRSRDRSAIRM